MKGYKSKYYGASGEKSETGIHLNLFFTKKNTISSLLFQMFDFWKMSGLYSKMSGN